MNRDTGVDYSVQIVRQVDADLSDAEVTAGLDAIFFETAPAAPVAGPERVAFYNLWLGQYLRHDREHVYLARAADGGIVGYLVGCWDDPARSPRFAGLAYFQAFAAHCVDYPAHLHINLTAAYRGRGVGAGLVAAFVGDAAAAGIAGVHVVTAADARNVSFYARLGFSERATLDRSGRRLVFLGRKLASPKLPGFIDQP
jgi:GNAT superfamily N-acetyltransferase